MLNHNQLENICFFKDPLGDGSITAFDKQTQDVSESYVAFGPRTAPDERLTLLLAAAPMLYQQLTLQNKALQTIIDLFEDIPVKNEQHYNLMSAFIGLQNGCLLAQRVAQEGVEKISAQFDNEAKRG